MFAAFRCSRVWSQLRGGVRVGSVEETRLPGMRDHIVLNVSHSGMLVSRAVAHQISTFLHDGTFEHARAEG